MDLQLQQLRSFITVAEELHFGRAGLRLGLSQPQVSRHIRALEDELGVVLFVRSARRTRLSDAGAALLDDARTALRASERLRERASVVADGGAGRVAVAFVWSTLGRYLAPLVAAAADRYSHIELSVCQLRYAEIVPSLRRGDIDLAIARPLHERTEMIELTLLREQSVLAMPEGHELARADVVSVGQLDGAPMIALRRELAPNAYDGAMAAAHERGVVPRIVQHARSPAEALALVSAGVGVYRVPASAAQPHPGVTYRALDGVRSRLVLLRRPEPPTPAVSAIADLAGSLFVDAPGTSNDSLGDLEAGLLGT